MIVLKALRLERGMTQQQVAEQIGVAKNAVSMWETGKRDPSFDKLIKLSDLFDCSVDYLLGRSEARRFAVITIKED